MDMGFSKIVSEKSLFFNLEKGGGVQNALDWINAHCDDKDFEEELFIVK